MSGETPDQDTYALKSAALADDCQRRTCPTSRPAPRRYRPRIGLIGAGGIAAAHLDAYRTAGWEVAAICGRTRDKAEARAKEFAPSAKVTDRFDEILADTSIDVLDITPHPADRLPLIEAALQAGKHVLSQKPFVLDLADGGRLVNLARDKGVKLAVNQNGRWAPHMSWMREAVQAGLIGEVLSVHVSIHWNHGWIAGTPFEKIEDLILYDFGIHWFDFVSSIVGRKAEERLCHGRARQRPDCRRAADGAGAGADGRRAGFAYLRRRCAARAARHDLHCRNERQPGRATARTWRADGNANHSGWAGAAAIAWHMVQ